MGSASSTLQVLDFATDFIPVVNLVKNTTIAIYDAATGDIDGTKQRAIQMFASAISTATLGAGDEFVVMADSIAFGPELMGAVEGTLGRLALSPSLQTKIMGFVAGQIGASPITVASKIIQIISSSAYDEGMKHKAKVEVMKALRVKEEYIADIPIDGFRWHWSKQPGKAMYEEADWGKWHCEKNIDLAEAVRIAMSNGYKGFFYCNESINLHKYGSFEKHSAVFFHDAGIATSPWLGSAPQCDYFKCENEIKPHWSKQPEKAMYEEADWGKWHCEKNIDLTEALRIAMSNGYKGFFYCNEFINLRKYGSFEEHSAVFFHDAKIATSPWLGSAPQCDYFKYDD